VCGVTKHRTGRTVGANDNANANCRPNDNVAVIADRTGTKVTTIVSVSKSAGNYTIKGLASTVLYTARPIAGAGAVSF